jgi:CDGSH-type Zn-finger protein/uncharacterized Fe-S cluster protein YjdI
MSDKLHKYRGKEIEVTYDAKRCIHAAECIRSLPQVFDTSRVPWVTPDSSTAERVAEAVKRCPTGALHFVRQDGGEEEAAPSENTIKVTKDGPLTIHGDIEILDAAGTVVARDTRVSLCRCGATENRPYCDNAHRKIGFKNSCALEITPKDSLDEEPLHNKLRIQPSPNGPLLIDGKVRIFGSVESTTVDCNSPALCRCGGSGAKPFCDGSHNAVGFEAP